MTHDTSDQGADRWSRRRFLQTSLGGLAAAGLGGSLLSACSSDGGDDGASGGVDGSQAVKIGVIAPFSGPGAFIGDVVNRSFDAALAEVENRGGLAGFRPEIVKKDGSLFPSQALEVYQELVADPEIIGVLWCGNPGLVEALSNIERDGVPLIAVFNDLQSDGLLYPDGPRNVFQMIQADIQAMNLLGGYCKNDRGYESVGLLFDTLTQAGTDATFEQAMAEQGLTNAGIERFTIGDGDFGPQLQRLRDTNCDALFVWGLAEETALIAKALADLDAAYVDGETARGADWHPHLMGSPGGLGEKAWAEQAGSAARPGTLTTWYVGGLVTNPTHPIRDWALRYNDVTVTGGEDAPANGMAALLVAAEFAGSTDREAIVEALEQVEVTFASPVSMSWTPERHHVLEQEDLVIITLERSDTENPYELGAEFDDVLAEGYVGPVLLVDPTFEVNQEKHPEVMSEIAELSYGTSCERQETDEAREACRATH